MAAEKRGLINKKELAAEFEKNEDSINQTLALSRSVGMYVF